MTADQLTLIEQLGYLGIFLAGAIPWFEAIGVVPAGILLGLDPVLTVAAAALGNIITIAAFAFAGDRIRAWLMARKKTKGSTPKTDRFEKAQRAFDRYGVYGMALLGPVIIGTQFAAAVSVAAGVKPMRVTMLVSASMIIWAALIAWLLVSLGVTLR